MFNIFLSFCINYYIIFIIYFIFIFSNIPNEILIYIKQILFNVYIFHFRGFIFNNSLINDFYNK